MTETDRQTKLISEDFPIGIFSRNVYLPNTHHHIEHEIFYLDSGSATVGIRNTESEISAKSIVFIEAGTEHFIRKKEDCGDFHYYALVFDSSILGDSQNPIRRTFESIRIKQFLNIPESLRESLAHAAQMEKDSSFGSKLILQTVLMEFLSHIIQTNQYQKITTLLENSKHSVSAVDTAIAYIKEHYRENIDIEDIFNETNYSKSHFSRLFKETSGKSLTEYINSYRVEKACLDMIYTDKNITEIAMENGFNNVQYFSRVFRQVMNCSPRHYKKSSRSVVVPSSFAAIDK